MKLILTINTAVSEHVHWLQVCKHRCMDACRVGFPGNRRVRDVVCSLSFVSLQVEMVSREVTIQVPRVIMEEVEVTYNVPAMETRSHTVQRPKTVM